jgi:hypothetical protein
LVGVDITTGFYDAGKSFYGVSFVHADNSLIGVETTTRSSGASYSFSGVVVVQSI